MAASEVSQTSPNRYGHDHASRVPLGRSFAKSFWAVFTWKQSHFMDPFNMIMFHVETVSLYGPFQHDHASRVPLGRSFAKSFWAVFTWKQSHFMDPFNMF